MRGDIKEIVGALMLVAAGGEASCEEVHDLSFDAEERLLPFINEAFIKLLEFAYDREPRSKDPELDRKMRGELDELLARIARVADNEFRPDFSEEDGFPREWAAALENGRVPYGEVAALRRRK